MSVIEKKIWPDYFDAVKSGEKTFELRTADFEIQPGDTLLLREWDPEIKQYTGRQIERKVGYIGKWKLEDLEKFYSKEDIENYGLQVISLL